MIYSDLNQDAPWQAPLLYDDHAVMQAVDNLLSTDKGSRLFRPEVYCDTDAIRMDLNLLSSSFAMYAEIVRAFKINDPRLIIHFDKGNVYPSPDNNAYELSMFFEIRGLGDRNVFEFAGVLSP